MSLDDLVSGTSSLGLGAPQSNYTATKLAELVNNYRLTPMTLALKLNPLLIPAKFHLFISAKIAAAIAKGNGRLTISAPPRHGKSEVITKNTPIWTLENYGKKDVILTTYGGELSADFGRQIRDLVQNNADLLRLRIRRDAHRANNWITDEGGTMRSVGIGGPITGRGADVLLIDDYIKEIKEAQSANHLQYLWDWFRTTAFTRLESGGTCIIIATRWAKNDLIGMIKKENPGEYPWEHITIPAIAGIDDILGRQPGEPLFPQRKSLNDLKDAKSLLGTYFFNTMFQQDPDDPNAQLTNKDWLKVITFAPEFTSDVKFIRMWDFASSEGTGDYTVGMLCAYDKRNDIFYILDIKRDQLSPGKVEKLVKKTAADDGYNVTVGLPRDPGSAGKSLVFQYENNILKGFKTKEMPTSNNKVVRAQPFLAAVEAGRVVMVQSAWNKLFADEYDDFPGGTNDDQVDAAGDAYVALTGKKFVKVAWGQDVEASRNIQLTPEKAATIRLPNGELYTPENYEVLAKQPKKTGFVWGRN